MIKNILRWKGGFCGDTVLKLILESYPNSKSNIIVENTLPTEQGSSIVKTSPIFFNENPNIYHAVKNLNYDKGLLIKELENIEEYPDVYFIKTHAYIDTTFNNKIIDFIATEDILPFIVNANIFKTETIDSNYNKLIHKIKDKNIKLKYTYYNVAYDSMKKINFDTNKLLVKNIINGWNGLTANLKNYDINLDIKVKNYYETWLKSNTKFFPSQKYKEMIKNSDYSWNDKSLSMSERYCLLLLANEKFEILT